MISRPRFQSVRNRAAAASASSRLRTGNGAPGGGVQAALARADKILDRQIALDGVEHRGFDGRLLLAVRDPVLSELDRFQAQIALIDEVVLGHIKRIGQGDQDRRARHGLVPLVAADHLGRHQVSDLLLQLPQR